MKLIVGLGNPGAEYAQTKHNVGFMVVDAIARKLDVELDEKKFNGIYHIGDEYILAKPQTYMNNSGSFVVEIMNYYKINQNDILIIQDDLDLAIGRATIKQKGSSGGHNGLKDIIQKLDTEKINRLKIGIGRSDNVVNYVLSKFTPNDLEVINKIIDSAADIALTYIYNDIHYVINKFNGKW